MVESLIQTLPKILERGKKETQKILDGSSGGNRISLQTNELVLPTKAQAGLSSFFGQPVKDIGNEKWLNRMIYGDNLLAMQSINYRRFFDRHTFNERKDRSNLH